MNTTIENVARYIATYKLNSYHLSQERADKIDTKFNAEGRLIDLIKNDDDSYRIQVV